MARTVTCPCGARIRIDDTALEAECVTCKRRLRVNPPRQQPLVSNAPREDTGSNTGQTLVYVGAGALVIFGVGFFLSFVMPWAKKPDAPPVASVDAFAGAAPSAPRAHAAGDPRPAASSPPPREELKFAGGAFEGLALRPRKAHPRCVQPRATNAREALASIRIEHGVASPFDVKIWGDPESARAAIEDLYRDPKSAQEIGELLDIRDRIYTCQRGMAEYIQHRRHEFNHRGYPRNGIDLGGNVLFNLWMDDYNVVIRDIEAKVLDRLAGVASDDIAQRALRRPIDPWFPKAAAALQAKLPDRVKALITRTVCEELDQFPVHAIDQERIASIYQMGDMATMQSKLFERLDALLSAGKANAALTEILNHGTEREQVIGLIRATPTGAGLGYFRQLTARAKVTLTEAEKKELIEALQAKDDVPGEYRTMLGWWTGRKRSGYR